MIAFYIIRILAAFYVPVISGMARLFCPFFIKRSLHFYEVQSIGKTYRLIINEKSYGDRIPTKKLGGKRFPPN
jgi:hypothetical protein